MRVSQPPGLKGAPRAGGTLRAPPPLHRNIHFSFAHCTPPMRTGQEMLVQGQPGPGRRILASALSLGLVRPSSALGAVWPLQVPPASSLAEWCDELPTEVLIGGFWGRVHGTVFGQSLEPKCQNKAPVIVVYLTLNDVTPPSF